MDTSENSMGPRCSGVEWASGQCMFDYKATQGKPCIGFYCNANGLNTDCAWCVYNSTQCNMIYTDGSCNMERPSCYAPGTVPSTTTTGPTTVAPTTAGPSTTAA